MALFKKGTSGNPKGKPKGSLDELTLLKIAVKKVGKKKGITLCEHFVERAYVSDMVLVALYKKLVADKTGIELPNDTDDPLRIIYVPAKTNRNNRDIPEKSGK